MFPFLQKTQANEFHSKDQTKDENLGKIEKGNIQKICI